MGRSGGESYALVTDALAPSKAVTLAADGARVVFDACGCGGAECALDWLPDDDVRDLVRSRAAPVVRPSKNGRADLEHWRSSAGRDLIVAAVEVTWGDRIRG